jgi:hypothetical protein
MLFKCKIFIDFVIAFSAYISTNFESKTRVKQSFSDLEIVDSIVFVLIKCLVMQKLSNRIILQTVHRIYVILF